MYISQNAGRFRVIQVGRYISVKRLLEPNCRRAESVLLPMKGDIIEGLASAKSLKSVFLADARCGLENRRRRIAILINETERLPERPRRSHLGFWKDNARTKQNK